MFETIETERLILRKFVIEDADAVLKNWASDSEVTKFLRWQPHKNIEVTKSVLEDWISNYDKEDCYQWAITLKDMSEPIGSIGVISQNKNTKAAHIGYCLSRTYWHQGITSEALQGVINFLFDNGFERIESMHDPNNPNSGGVMKKCGLKYEGTLRKADFNNQGICDACIYSILSTER